MASSMRRQRLFAQAYDRATAGIEQAWLGQARRSLLSEARGRVLELGAGTGANLPHYPPGAELTLSEPSPPMREQLTAKLGARSGEVRVLPNRAAELSLDEPFDTVVSTLVLCSVDDLAATLGRVRALLAPGGQLLVIEHVGATGWLGRLQRVLAPLHAWYADGCRLDRDIARALADAGFDTGGLAVIPHRGSGPVRPFLTGRLGVA